MINLIIASNIYEFETIQKVNKQMANLYDIKHIKK